MYEVSGPGFMSWVGWGKSRGWGGVDKTGGVGLSERWAR